jgi:hypothetical protein
MRLTPEQRAAFGRWLLNCGAEVLPPVGEWEIFRVIANGTTYSAYARKSGFQSWPIPLQLLYTQHREGAKVPKLGSPVKPMSSNRRGRIVQIAARDGWRCWYCQQQLQPLGYAEIPGAQAATLEEVCPRQIGGPTHIGNQVVACQPCNTQAANLSVAEKVRMRDRKRAGRKQPPTGHVDAQIRFGGALVNGLPSIPEMETQTKRDGRPPIYILETQRNGGGQMKGGGSSGSEPPPSETQFPHGDETETT